MLVVNHSVLPPAELVPTYTAIGEPEHFDFRESLFKALTQVTSGTSVDSNPRLVDPQSATLTTRSVLSTRNGTHTPVIIY